MAMAAANYPFPLGGHPNGRYRTAASQASSSASNQTSAANLGAFSAFQNAQNVAYPEPTVASAGIRTGEITAVRAWELRPDGLLHSMFSVHIWMPNAVEHAPKVRVGYGEGLHAFKTLGRAKQEYGYGYNIVFGEVELWGEVIEYEQGWKAEFAAIKSLLEYNGGDGLTKWMRWWRMTGKSELDLLRERYGLVTKI